MKARPAVGAGHAFGGPAFLKEAGPSRKANDHWSDRSPCDPSSCRGGWQVGGFALRDRGHDRPQLHGATVGGLEHFADTAEPPLRLRAFASAIQQVIKSAIFGDAETQPAVRWVAYSPASYLNETRSFVRY